MNTKYTFVNTTPHDVTVVVAGNSVTFPKSDNPLRLSQVDTKVDDVNGLPLFKTTFGDCPDLPSPKDDTLYIVSMVFKTAYPDRRDFVVPSQPIRDDQGRVIGCKGFSL